MDATEKLHAFLAELSIRKKRVEADIVANFQMLEEVLYQDGCEIQNSLSISLKGRNLRTPGNTSELFQKLVLS
jgi:hypothetical protein